MQPDHVTVFVDASAVHVPAGATVLTALVCADQICTRRSVTGEPRFALCGIGQCHECRVTIDDRAHRLACQVRCEDGMRIATAAGEAL